MIIADQPHSRAPIDPSVLLGPIPISMSDFRISPRKQAIRQTDANRTHPETAEHQGSLIIADQLHSRAHIDSSVLLDPNPISVFDFRINPRKQAVRQTDANRTHPETAEYQGSLIIADQLHSRAHIDSSVLLDPNPISVFDFRINPRKQAVRQTASIRTHPRTAKSRGSQTMTSQPPNRPRLRIRTQSNPDGQSPNWSTTVVPTADDQHLHPAGNSGIPMLSESGQSGTQPIPQPR
ncbi:hypothetical protein [Bifidobacterium thermacidophilum]|uniref:hypothetical protein n=1 Tax=Bifidobacterium thermacidophilum TaxID=246618 RepID=UPI0005C6D132|nr:hypothetical protein [Bifidobacterium thermacidophilum]